MLSEFFADQSQPNAPELLILATVGSSNSSGTTLIFDGLTTATTKRYRKLKSYTPISGERVLVAKINGSYVILGAVQS